MNKREHIEDVLDNKMGAYLAVILILFATFLTTIANAKSNSLNLQRISELSGEFRPHFIYKEHIFAPGNGVLDIIDLHNSAFPQLVNSLSNVSGFYMTFDDNMAYVSTGTSVLFLDLTDLENPLLINQYNDFEPIGNVYPFVDDLAIYGDTLYVGLDYFADNCPLAGKIAILDASDPLNPVRIGTKDFPLGVGDIEVVGDKLMVLSDAEVFIYSLHNPNTLTFINGFSPGNVYHRSANLRLIGDHVLINYVPVSYPCLTAGTDLSILVDVSNLPEVSILYTGEGSEKYIKGYTDGYIYAGGALQVDVYHYPDYTDLTASFDESITSFNIPEGFILTRESDPDRLTTFRLSTISETIDPNSGSALIYTDTLGVTIFDLPAGAVLSPTVVSVLPLPKADFPPLLSTQIQAFDIRGHLPDHQLTLERFQQPITATLPITVSQPSFTTTRAFLYWTDTHWVDAATTCASFPVSFPETGEFPGNLDSNTVQFCRPGKYGVFEMPVLDHNLYLPAVFRYR